MDSAYYATSQETTPFDSLAGSSLLERHIDTTHLTETLKTAVI